MLIFHYCLLGLQNSQIARSHGARAIQPHKYVSGQNYGFHFLISVSSCWFTEMYQGAPEKTME